MCFTAAGQVAETPRAGNVLLLWCPAACAGLGASPPVHSWCPAQQSAGEGEPAQGGKQLCCSGAEQQAHSDTSCAHDVHGLARRFAHWSMLCRSSTGYQTSSKHQTPSTHALRLQAVQPGAPPCPCAPAGSRRPRRWAWCRRRPSRGWMRSGPPAGAAAGWSRRHPGPTGRRRWTDPARGRSGSPPSRRRRPS